MVTEAGKELLRNTINTAKFHNKILEENEMWKQWELECGLTMMVSDDDVIKKIKKSHQCSKHRKRDKSRSRDRSRSRGRQGTSKTKLSTESSNDRWDHSGFAELYPDADVPDKYPSVSHSSSVRYAKKNKKKSHRRSNSSDKEIWEEFKRPAKGWNKESTLRLIELLRTAPALWNVNYPGYRNCHVKLRELKRIASEFYVKENEIANRIAFLINAFDSEHKKRSLKNFRGACAKSSEHEWFAYEHLTFLIKNNYERQFKNVENDPAENKNPQWFDSSDSYSESEEETSTLPSAYRCTCSESPEQDGDSERETSSPDDPCCIKNRTKYAMQSDHQADESTSSPYLKKDGFSVFGDIVARRLRDAKKSSRAVGRAKCEINVILERLATGFFDSPEETS